uniref:Histone H2A n=1 Tax=Oryza nivara TaxID=4536 RepID=A0A0E0I7X8_ORYNI
MDAVGGGKVKKAASERKASGPRKKAVTRFVKAGLQFPVGRIGRYLKKSQPVDLLSAAPSPSAAPTLFPTVSVTLLTLFPTDATDPLPYHVGDAAAAAASALLSASVMMATVTDCTRGTGRPASSHRPEPARRHPGATVAGRTTLWPRAPLPVREQRARGRREIEKERGC